ncbi:MAG: Fic family protein [Candidatus Pacebacteria bacterium]|nr:Fic family protein [Candidatus Paceibacterota bacterium]
MDYLNNRQLDILKNIKLNEEFSSSDVLGLMDKKQKVSLITIKRDLDYLSKAEYLKRKGKGRSTVYQKTIKGILFSPVDLSVYDTIEPDKRIGNGFFNFRLFKEFPLDIFSDDEKNILDSATAQYKKNIKKLTPTIHVKELERFIIELSWKSSKIEGNTYTLLDTERLIREGIPAKGHSQDEAIMILNHKRAFSFILENIEGFKKKGVNVVFIEKVHEIIIEKLGIARGIRNGLVGIVGTKYKPLDNKYQIKEALESLCELVNKMKDVYSGALTLLAGLSYIQPFEDGNKRTARLLCNAVLLSKGCAPLSYRSIDENIYKKSILAFYEENSIVPMKEIFTEQYLFSARNYLVNAH